MSLDIKIVGDKELQIYLENIKKDMKETLISGLDEIGNHLQKEVKDKFGNYQSSWPKLKRASVIAKYKKRGGLKKGKIKRGSLITIALGPDDPLILFGDLKESIEKEINSGALEAIVYSDNPYSAVHEYGYKSVPARSYLRLTLWDEENNVVKIIDNKISRLL